jgi:hypothetical protein
MSDDSRIKVIYIAGWGRSGTTIMANVLGQLSGFFSVGEVRFLWERGLGQNILCGCGRRVRDCPTWKTILQQAFGEGVIDKAPRWANLAVEETRTRNLLADLVPGIGLRNAASKSAEYIEVLRRLYESIATVTRSNVIVDSSKFPAYGHFLRRVPGLDVFILHMMRDPRGVAHSWSQVKAAKTTPAGGTTPVINPLVSTVRWIYWNLAIEHVGARKPTAYRRVRYEDFVHRPRSTTASIVRLVGGGSMGLPFEDDHTVRLSPTHSISGNPMRFDLGAVALVADTRWTREMPFARMLAVSLLAAPLLARYGYPVWPRRGTQPDLAGSQEPQSRRVESGDGSPR